MYKKQQEKQENFAVISHTKNSKFIVSSTKREGEEEKN